MSRKYHAPVVLFGCAVSDEGMFERVGLPSVRRVAEPDSRLLVRRGYDSIQEPYNDMLEEAAACAGLEALVLIHQDLELLDDSLLRRVRPLLAQPRVGVVSPLGWRDVDLHLWSSSGNQYGSSRTPDLDSRHSAGSHEVDIVDGVLLVLAPWVVRTIRFSDALADDFHGYDVDFSLRVRAAGGMAIADDIPYLHHMARPWRDRAEFARASAAVARSWQAASRPLEWAPAFHR